MQHSDAPYIELARATEAIEAMLKTASLDDFEEHWKTFLHRIERTWNKAHAHFGKSPRWNGWHGRFENLRKTDPLLSYLTNARGAEEHTVAEIVEREAGGIGINPAEGNSLYIRSMRQVEGKLLIDSPQALKVTFIPARTKLLPVTNRGRIYSIPNSHLGAKVDPTDVPALAEAAVRFYRDALQQAEAFFVK